MKLFGQFVRTLVNTVELPLAVAKDIATLGGSATGQDQSYTEQKLQQIAEESSE